MTAARRRSIHKHRALSFRTLSRGDLAYEDAAEFLRQRYAASYGQRTVRVAPRLLVASRGSRIVGCLGVTPAETGPMLVERYLDQPAHVLAGAELGIELDRSEVIEVGSLATSEPRVVLSLFAEAPQQLQDGYAVAFMTATTQVRRLLASLHLRTAVLGPADPASLTSEERAAWGSYYTQDPQVLFLELDGLERRFATPARSVAVEVA